MGFFKDFKDDFSQAVNELMPGDELTDLEDEVESDDMVVNTLDAEVDTESELSKLNGLLEHVDDVPEARTVVKPQQVVELEKEFAREVKKADVRTAMEERTKMNEQTMAAQTTQNAAQAAQNAAPAAPVAKAQVSGVNPEAVSDETTVITEGTNITGDINSDGSVDIRGRIGGNVTCNGKLVVTGILEGNSNSSEFFADAAKVEGEVNSTGTVKIGIGSVVIGNITAASAVIAGAIKGDIDVQGPVVVDTSAVVMGNIKSRSVQINNGAVIEGFCSQSYADIDVQGLFDEKRGN
jgi:cytoskeletal protein CcmA (bactofilin family)